MILMILNFIIPEIPAIYYSKIYNIVIFALCMLIAMYYFYSAANEKVHQSSPVSQIGAVFFMIVVIMFIGLRPISGKAFTDMIMYAHTYNNILDGYTDTTDSRGEWLFVAFGNFCKRMGLTDTQYFLYIATIYFGLMLIVCWRLMRNNLFVAVLFCVASFSCFSYGVNGIRNGMACSIALMAIALLCGNKWEKLGALVLMFCAMNIHRSTALPCLCAITALFAVKNTKQAIYFWVASIFVSLMAGNMVTEFFVSIGFDDRMEQYANLDEFGEVMTSRNLKSGFRIDFIIYSIMPIIMAWFVTMKRNFQDKTYHIIATTYILANAFWVMVIRSEQSNRFAYLSWFLYPLVIAYPLLRMNIWEDQDRKTAMILLAYSGFTFFMNFVYYA